MLTYAHAYANMQGLDREHALMLSHVCSRMLTYANMLDREHALMLSHACSRMLTYANMQGLDREHALMLTGALPSLLLNHLQVQHT
jgi:hypothetical protein